MDRRVGVNIWRARKRQAVVERAVTTVEQLELRRMLSASGPIDFAALGLDSSWDALDATVSQPTNQTVTNAGSAKYPLTSIPALNSDPSATAQLYLDFVGNANLHNTPAYDQDGDPTTFTDSELANIRLIWQGVAEKYSPFNVNITTVDPGNLSQDVAACILIGGNGSWTGQTMGGISSTGGFSSQWALNHTSFVFPANLGNGDPHYTTDAVAHEGGHLFGLSHQSVVVNGTVTQEYNPGDANKAPIIGIAYNSARGLWWNGLNDQAQMQDDMAVISSTTNGFGYRSDDHGNTMATAGALSVSGSSLSGSGIIEKTTDADYFSFTTTAGGTVSFTGNVASFEAMLDMTLKLVDSNNNVIATATNSATMGQTLSATVPGAGTYYLVVGSAGNYGDVGQYTISGTLPSGVPDTTSVSISGNASVNEGSTYTLNLSASGTNAASISSWTINWGDGGAAQVFTGNPTSVTHVYADGLNAYNITAGASAGGQTYNATSKSVTVNNVAPTLTISGSAAANVGAAYTLSLASSDPGSDTISSWIIHWGDGSAAQTVVGNPSSVTHTYSSTAAVTISATATDEDGTYSSNSLAVQVGDTTAVSLSGNASVNEGSLYTLVLSATGSNAASISSWTINWGDGGAAQVVSGNPTSVTHTYADGPNSDTITATASAAGNTYTASLKTVTISNVAPTLTLNGAASVVQGALYTLNLSSSDPGADTITSWVITWGDGTGSTLTGNPSSTTHTYSVPAASRTISATATDEDGTYSAPWKTISVTDSTAVSISGSASVAEVAVYTLSLSATGSNASNITSWTINWGDGTAAQVVTGNPSSVTKMYAHYGAYTISATATTGSITYTATSKSLSVSKVAPTLAISGSASSNEGSLYTLNLSATEVDTDSISSWVVAWGDGTSTTIAGNPSSTTHTYADGPNSFTISATATDQSGTYSANSKAVAVNNVAPTLTISGNSSVAQGALYTLNLFSSDPGADTISSWTINWGDGSAAQVVAGHPASVTHTYTSPGSLTISASATDEDGAYSSNTKAVTVSDTTAISISGNASVNEGSLYTLTLASSGSNAANITSWTINWGDGSAAQVINGNPTSATHTYADGPNAFNITASASAGGLTYNATAKSVTVNNVAPVLTISGANTATQGATYTLNLASTDPGADTITSWRINWGDGTSSTVQGHPTSVTNAFVSTGSFTITATATDEDGTYSANSIGVAVNAPAALITPAISGNASVNESSTYTLNLSATGSQVGNITGWTITWGDGSTQAITGNPSSVTKSFAHYGNYTIFASATDGTATYNAAPLSLKVNKLAPAILISGSSSIAEGSTYTLNLAASEADSDTIQSWTISWGDGTTTLLSGSASTATKTFATHGSYTIHATGTDQGGTWNSNAQVLNVTNVPPTLTISGASSVAQGATYTLNLSATDPGGVTVHSWTINWGDGTTSTLTANPSTATHTFNSAINATISATATDNDGTWNSNTLGVTVNAPPVSATVSGASTTNEGSTYTLNLTATGSGAGSINSWTINWGDGSLIQTFTGNPSAVTHIYADGPNAFTISASATAGGVTYNAPSQSVTVSNVVPTLVISGDATVTRGQPYTLHLNSADPGADTITGWTIDWGDGSGPQALSGNPSSATFAYAMPGNYNITATATDEDGTYGPMNVTVTVNAAPSDLSLAGKTDFNGDGIPDLVYHDDITGENFVQLLNAQGQVSSTLDLPSNTDPHVRVTAAADLNGNGMTDLLVRNSATGANVIWVMDGTEQVGTINLPKRPAAWNVITVADFTGDGHPDILWRNAKTGADNLWGLNAKNKLVQRGIGSIGGGKWSIAAVSDFNGDSRPDILWHNTSTGVNTLWLMKGTARKAVVKMPSTNPTFSVAAISDVNNDGIPDVLWKNRADDSITAWLMSGTSVIGTASV